MKKPNAGLTLIELIVVVSIISILFAMLIPAVQSAREATRRMHCSSNLKQTVFGLQSYHDVFKTFPLNTSFGDPLGPEYQTRSWMQGILPFIEQRDLHDRVHSGTAVATNRQVAEASVNLYLCPSSGSGEKLDNRADVPPEWTLGLTNYKSCAGSNWAWGRHVRASVSGRFAGEFDGMSKGNGLICAGRGAIIVTRTVNVSDGLSNTYAIGETLPEWSRWSWWFHSNSVAGTCASPLNFSRQLRNQDRWEDNNGFMSNHPAGANFALVDGSVRFVAETLDSNVYSAFGTIDSGELP